MRTLKLKKKEDLRIRSGHTWVFSNEVDTTETPLSSFKKGEEVTVCDAKGMPLGSALCTPNALICARIYSEKADTPCDENLIAERLKKALQLREGLFSTPWYRLVHGEGDFLPGVIIDRYDDHLTIEITTFGMEERKEMLLSALSDLIRPKSILFTNALPVRALEGLDQENTSVGNVPAEIVVEENGAHFHIPLREGQKTGWFFDQRDNRRMAARFAKDKDVLDAFCYVGGFGVLCAKEGAAKVTFLDSSKKALEKAQQNMHVNAPGVPCDILSGDAMEELMRLKKEGRRFDLISIDPPAFIKHRKDCQEGIRLYRRLNALALSLLNNQGILVSSSCSYHLRAETLFEALSRGAAKNGLRLQLLYQGRQGFDHPERIGQPETSYLKCFIVRANTYDF